MAAAVADTGRTCALDPGRARVGLAIDDELGLLAHPRGTLDPRDPKAFAARLRELADATGRIVEMWDERLSTVQAQRALSASEVRGAKARARIDEAAACAILQSWLDARRARRGAR